MGTTTTSAICPGSARHLCDPVLCGTTGDGVLCGTASTSRCCTTSPNADGHTFLCGSPDDSGSTNDAVLCGSANAIHLPSNGALDACFSSTPDTSPDTSKTTGQGGGKATGPSPSSRTKSCSAKATSKENHKEETSEEGMLLGNINAHSRKLCDSGTAYRLVRVLTTQWLL